jgi:acetate---CoA ligase (ADP-forming)
MVDARSIALVGASVRPQSVGRQMLVQLVKGGFAGEVFPVNPKYEEIEGYRCYPTVGEIPGPADLAVLAVPDAVLESELRAVADAGVPTAVVFGGSTEATSPDGPSLSDRLGAIAEERGVALCGPNGMGFVNFHSGLRAVGFWEPLTRRPGGVTLLTHSGSVFSAFLHNDRGLEFDLAISTGQEAVLTVADYLAYALERETTEVVGLFLETVRDPSGFVAALETAADRDVPVVALKVGREPRAKDMVRTHSGALAGDDAAYDALFDAYGVLRVRTLDEMADTLELLSGRRRAGPGGLAALHDSGGERAHLVDVAADVGVEFARISDPTVQRLAARLDTGLLPANPLDAWSTGLDYHAAYVECMAALHDDPDTAAIAFVVDLTAEEAVEDAYVPTAREMHRTTTKPFAVLGNLASAIDREQAARLRSEGIAVLEGTATGLAAFRHLFHLRDVRARPEPRPTPRPPEHVTARWRARLAQGDRLDEAEALSLLSDHGIAVPQHERVSDLDAALAAARGLGWPLVLKTGMPGVDHKTDVGGVIVGIRNEEELAHAYGHLREELGPAVLLAEQVPSGVELALGLVNDPQFGPLVIVAAGGVFVELAHDRVVALPPVDEVAARRLLDRLAVRQLLDGARGGNPADVSAVVDAVTRVSALAETLGDHLAEVDVNPLLAGPHGCVAVDCLVVPRSVTEGAARPHA